MRMPRPSSPSLAARKRHFRRSGAVALDHLLVVDEAAGGEDHPAARADELLAPVDARGDAEDAAGLVDDERLHQDVRLHPRSCALHRGDQPLHEHGAGLDARVLDGVAARRRARHVDVRVRELASRVAEAVVGRRVRALAVVGRLEGHALRDEPVEVRDAVVAVRGGSSPRPAPARRTPGGT
jgi:hypothetical protein